MEGGAYVTTDEGLLPIHLASHSGFTAGIRTLLSSNFNTIAIRENTEMMLSLDFAVNELSDENSSLMDEDDPAPMEESSNENPNRNVKSSVELILSSILYDRLISLPRQAGDDYPFLPLHGAAMARPTLETWNALVSIYPNHALDVDSEGRTVTHLICLEESDDVENDIGMLATVDEATFKIFDQDGFLPLHRALASCDVSFEFIKAVTNRQQDAIYVEVGSGNEHSSLANLLPVQVAALHDCELDIIFDLLKITAGILR